MPATITLDQVIAYLNDLHQLDPVAIYGLISTRALCNQAIAAHPTLQVAEYEETVRDGATPILVRETSVLALINGIFGIDSNGRGPITAIVTAEHPARLLGFRRTDNLQSTEEQ